jgi:hypothetical protein
MTGILYYLFGAHHCLYRSALWTGIAVIVAAVGVVVALRQLRRIEEISRADFAKRFLDTFFVPETRTLFGLLMNSALEFDVLV